MFAASGSEGITLDMDGGALLRQLGEGHHYCSDTRCREHRTKNNGELCLRARDNYRGPICFGDVFAPPHVHNLLIDLKSSQLHSRYVNDLKHILELIPSMTSRFRLSALSKQLSPVTSSLINAPRRTLASMSQTQTPSAACCNTPAVVSKDYKEKGSWTTVDGLKTYVTGPSSAKQGILVIYDIFGFFPQTLQGADILAHADGDHQYQVFMPDFFEGNPADISWYPPDTDEKGKKLGEFFQTTAAPPKAVEKVKSVMKELSSKNAGISSWGVVGYCWGGKVRDDQTGEKLGLRVSRLSTLPPRADLLSKPPQHVTPPWSIPTMLPT
jgi:hypothetical protein